MQNRIYFHLIIRHIFEILWVKHMVLLFIIRANEWAIETVKWNRLFKNKKRVSSLISYDMSTFLPLGLMIDWRTIRFRKRDLASV